MASDSPVDPARAPRRFFARVLPGPGEVAAWYDLGGACEGALRGARALCAVTRPGRGRVFLYRDPPLADGLPGGEYLAGWRRDDAGALVAIP